jgi:hypothetical protein
MADDMTRRGQTDSARVINAYGEHEVRYWCKEFGCTEEELFDAVDAVGTMSDKVRAHMSLKFGRAKASSGKEAVTSASRVAGQDSTRNPRTNDAAPA